MAFVQKRWSCHQCYCANALYRATRMTVHQQSFFGATIEIEMHDGMPFTRYRAGSPKRKSRPPTDCDVVSVMTLIDGWTSGRKIKCAEILKFLPKDPPFLAACWRASLSIPAGETRTYGWLAAAAGRPTAHRAAAQSMARNPLAPLVPCHRVLGANCLGGFCGANASTMGDSPSHWALALKRRLIEIESKPAPRTRFSKSKRKSK